MVQFLEERGNGILDDPTYRVALRRWSGLVHERFRRTRP
jgi:hypothetical protein